MSGTSMVSGLDGGLAEVLAQVARERDRQDVLHPGSWAAKSRVFQLLKVESGAAVDQAHRANTVLGEEVGEVARAILESDWENLRVELIQVAAVAVAFVQAMDGSVQ